MYCGRNLPSLRRAATMHNVQRSDLVLRGTEAGLDQRQSSVRATLQRLHTLPALRKRPRSHLNQAHTQARRRSASRNTSNVFRPASTRPPMMSSARTFRPSRRSNACALDRTARERSRRDTQTACGTQKARLPHARIGAQRFATQSLLYSCPSQRDEVSRRRRS